MKNISDKSLHISVDLKTQPLTIEEITLSQEKFKSHFKSNLSFILAVVVLGAGVAFRAITLNYDNELELFNISLYIGLWFGVFTGFMIDGSAKRKLQMVFVAVILSASASLFAAMLITLFVGYPTIWISSLNILASALACMWVLTHYDEVLKGIEALRVVDEKQFSYIRKASSNFDELYRFSEKIIAEERMPINAEYWAYRDWVKEKAEENNKKK